ncbi:MAG: glycosyltransferase family 2 protein [Myxococcaceae bacterium]
MKPMVMVLAYNVEKTLAKTYQAIPDSLKPYVIVGDNRSTDGTVDVCKRLGLRYVTHDVNAGYGGNLKRLFKIFLHEKADVALEVHGDFQYQPALADLMYEYVARGYYDLIQGCRIRTRKEALEGGMPLYRWLGNRTLTLFENLWFGTVFGEWHSGMRAYSKKLISEVPLDTFSDTHAFASDIMMEAVAQGFRVAEVPCPVRYENDSSSVDLPGLFGYTFRTVRSALQRPPWKRKLPFDFFE